MTIFCIAPLLLVLFSGLSPSTAFVVHADRTVEHSLGSPRSACRSSSIRRANTVLLLASNQDEDQQQSQGARVRFSGSSSSATVSNPVDLALSWIASDVGSIILGVGGIVLLLIGRLALDVDDSNNVDNLGQVTRSNLLAVFAAGAVLLNGLSKLDVESTLAQSVQLVGTRPEEPVLSDSTPDSLRNELAWMLDSLLQATPTKSAVVLERQTNDNDKWTITALAGIVPSTTTSSLTTALNDLAATPILDRSVKQQPTATTSPSSVLAETYLPTLQALPGRTEFTYLPPNAQAVLILPVSTQTVLVLGSDQAKSFTPRDIAWCQVVVARLAAVATGVQV